MLIVDRHSTITASCSRRARLGALAVCLLASVLALAVPSAGAATTPMVDLGTSAEYAVLSGASVGNTVSAGGAPHTTLRGGLAVEAATQPLGFPPGIVTGPVDIGNATADRASDDATAAYDDIASRSGGVPLAGALAGTTIGPGLYLVAGAVSNTTTVTLDAGGDPNAVFVFQVGGALAMAAGSHVVLANGAQASHVFWQVNGAGAVGANSGFAGTLIALNAVAIGNGTIVNGRAFALNGALTLDANEFYSSPPVVTIDGGTSDVTAHASPTISGTTDIEAPALVHVEIDGQTLTAAPSAGAWSVTSELLANATYPVVASVTDGASNTTSATQSLTVDTVLPVVTLSGGPSSSTDDPTPIIAGTTDVAPGSTVLVTLGTQTLTAFVQPDGTWNVTPAALEDGAHTVTAEVLDLAGNAGDDSQLVTVDTLAPAVTIAGGTLALTNDATPTIAGTAEVAPGTSVTVTLADETLTALVDGDGDWSVTSSALADGAHRVIVDVSDEVGNPSTLTQTLTIDTAAPAVAISGGAVATTDEADPTITGCSDAAPGTIVTVSLAGQTLTTLVQPNGTWNATPAAIGGGVWLVSAAVPDPAGNIGSATQSLTVSVAVPLLPVAPLGDGVIAPITPIAHPATPDLPTLVPTPPSTLAPGGTRIDALARTTIGPDGVQTLTGSSLSIATKVTAPAGTRLDVTVGGSLKIAGVAKTIRLTTQKRVLIARTLTLKIAPPGSTAAARAIVARCEAAIKAGKKVSATITVTLVDEAGHTRTALRVVKLT